jgi:general secretion pathway protein A
MYASFFGLNEKPFSITPDPRFLFLSERHAEALAHLVYGINEAGGFIQLTGEVGTGKTTVVRSLLAQAPKHAEIALILNPRMTPAEFLLAICEELGIKVEESSEDSLKDLVDLLSLHLLKAHSEGKRIVLVVDEAQNLAAEVLEQVRLLTNLETETQKLLQIILIGQPELRELLDRTELRQLAQRITARYHLDPLSPEETAAYVRHRLRVAGATREVFTTAQCARSACLSGGVPRLINIICDRAVARRLFPRSPRGHRQLRAPRRGRGIRQDHPAALVAVGHRLGRGGAGHRQRRAHRAAFLQGGKRPHPPRLRQCLHRRPHRRRRRRTSTNYWRSTTPKPTRTMPSTNYSRRGACATSRDRWTPAARRCSRGLECLTQRGSLAQLRLFNRPAVLNVIGADGRAHQLLLAGLDEEHALVDLGGAKREIGIGDLSRSWFGDYVLLWKPATGGSQPLALGARNARVKWLRDSLRRVNGLPAEDGGNTFDQSLVTLVEEFQRKNRLAVDGIAGVQTQVALDAALNDATTPFLRNAAGADMSFILDALKKSETDRQRQASPALFEVKVAAPRRKFPTVGRRPGRVAAGEHGGAGLGAAAAFRRAWRARRRRARRPRPENAPANPAPATARNRAWSPCQIPVGSKRDRGTRERSPRAPRSLQRHTALAEEPLLESQEPAVPPDYDARDYRPAITPEQAGAIAAARRNGSLPSRDEVLAQGNQLPDLRLDLHVYDPDPARASCSSTCASCGRARRCPRACASSRSPRRESNSPIAASASCSKANDKWGHS